MEYIMLITYSWDSDYVAIPCETESKAREMLNKYLNDEVETIKNESEYEPTVVRYEDGMEAELIYAEEQYVDSNTDIATYKVIKVGHGYIKEEKESRRNRCDSCIYEVDLRSRETGNSVECIYSGDFDGAWDTFHDWYNRHPSIKKELDEQGGTPEPFVGDGGPGYFADVIQCDKKTAHGVGKFNPQIEREGIGL